VLVEQGPYAVAHTVPVGKTSLQLGLGVPGAGDLVVIVDVTSVEVEEHPLLEIEVASDAKVFGRVTRFERRSNVSLFIAEQLDGIHGLVSSSCVGSAARPKQDLDRAVLLLLEVLIRFRAVLQRKVVSGEAVDAEGVVLP
jgi:hypothetical protein